LAFKKGHLFEKPPRHDSPPVSKEAVERSRAIKDPVDELEILTNGGLKVGDVLVFTWVVFEKGVLSGCEIAVTRNGSVLKWVGQGLANYGGTYVRLPYIKTAEVLDKFVAMMTTLCGYGVRELKVLKDHCRAFRLESVKGESQRLIPGDSISFDAASKQFCVRRVQDTLDMKLAHPGQDGISFSSDASYITLVFHPFAVARLLSEANGLRARSADGAFHMQTRSLSPYYPAIKP
jgi:hypothetical protein